MELISLVPRVNSELRDMCVMKRLGHVKIRLCVMVFLTHAQPRHSNRQITHAVLAKALVILLKHAMESMLIALKIRNAQKDTCVMQEEDLVRMMVFVMESM